MGEADALLGVPAVISFILLLIVFWLHGRILYVDIQKQTDKSGNKFLRLWGVEEPGDFAWLQFWTCFSAFVSVVGGCIESLGFYDDSDPGGWCQFEALCSSFGELAVILWVICSCIYLYAQLKEYLTSVDIRRKLFVRFHAGVWSLAFLLTVIPAGQGLLGFNTNSDGSETWCWFKPGFKSWEWAQFYAPLLIYVVISSIAFVSCIRIIHRRLSTPTQPSAQLSISINTPAPAEERQIENEGVLYVRMAWQFGVLFIVYLPDLIAVLVDEEGGSFHSASRGAEFLWRCEGLALATMYLLNGRVRTLSQQLPEIQICCKSNKPNAQIEEPLPTVNTPSDLRPKPQEVVVVEQ